MEPTFQAFASGEHIHLTLGWGKDDSTEIMEWRVRSRPFLLRLRLFSAKRRLYRAYRKYMRCKSELDEA